MEEERRAWTGGEGEGGLGGTAGGKGERVGNDERTAKAKAAAKVRPRRRPSAGSQGGKRPVVRKVRIAGGPPGGAREGAGATARVLGEGQAELGVGGLSGETRKKRLVLDKT